MNVIGITATQEGLTQKQLNAVTHFLCSFKKEWELHHGACVGGDEEIVNVAAQVPMIKKIVAHPGHMVNKPHISKRSLGAMQASHEHKEQKPYLARNQDIIDACSVLLACPKEPFETVRSGTWTTIRHARIAGKRVIIIWPDGSIAREQ